MIEYEFPDKPYVPEGRGAELRVQAFERAIAELPLEEASIERNPVSGGLDFVAPDGFVWRIEGENLRHDRFKPWVLGGQPQRSEANSPLVEDPDTLNNQRLWHGGVQAQEHFATRLTLRTKLGHVFGRRPHRNHQTWTQVPDSGSSDGDIHVALLDPPQAWTQTTLTPFSWSVNNHPMSPRFPTYIPTPLAVYGMRQAYVHGSVNSTTIELVEIDRDRMVPDDDMVRSSDGRALQVALRGEPGSEGVSILPIKHPGMNSSEWDDFMRETQNRSFYDLPKGERLRRYRAGHRNMLGFASGLTPFADDALRDFTIVRDDPATGEPMTIERAIELLREEVRLQNMLPHELEAEVEQLGPNPERYAVLADGYIQPIKAQTASDGSLQTSLSELVRRHCGDDWKLVVGQNRKVGLFGRFESMRAAREVAEALGSLSLDQAVKMFASRTWRADDVEARRTTALPDKHEA